jgi:octaprenyl-diphosphate synthase
MDSIRVGPDKAFSNSAPQLPIEQVSSGSFRANPPAAYKDQFRAAILPIQTELGQVESLLRSELKSRSKSISEILEYVAELGGKRLRPCLVLLAAKAAGSLTEESVRLAAVVELVHTATLIHDDVLDHAAMRRHKVTVHERWDVPTSILIGDWLFAHAYGLANKGNSTLPGRWIADSAKQVCEGEIRQGQSVNHFGMTLDEYLELLEGKTGALCAVSCSLGAWSGGGSETTCYRLQQYGLKLGTAFQVFDDWLDIWGVQDQAGKTLGTDLEALKPTLPTLRTLSLMKPDARESLTARLTVGDSSAIQELRQRMSECDASSFTKQFACDLIRESVSYLNGLPESVAVDSLRQLAYSSINRNG